MNLEDVEKIISEVAPEALNDVMSEIEKVELEDAFVIPAHMNKGNTVGDWSVGYGDKFEELRPDSALSYTIINEMLKSGVIRFATEMKRSQMVSIFRNQRSVKVHSPDEELKEITEAVIDEVLPQTMWEISWQAMVYGSAYAETLWENRTKYNLGLSKGKTSRSYTVPKVPNFVPHNTVAQINRKKDGTFDGFDQDPLSVSGLINRINHQGMINVPATFALVVPYNGYSRNLWGESFLKTIYPLWFWYEIILRACVQYSERMGDPPRIGRAPSNKKVRVRGTTTLVDSVDWMYGISANLPKTNTIVVYSDKDPETNSYLYDLSYLELPERSQPFVNILQHFGDLILRAALIADRAVTQSGESGSFAIGEIHQAATALHNEMVATNWLYYLNRFWIKNISLFNKGVDGPPVRLEVAGLDPKERVFLEKVMGVAGNSKTFQEFFYKVDWSTLANLAGLPVLSQKESDELKSQLQEEALDNERNQMSLAKEFESPNLPKDEGSPSLQKKIDTQKEEKKTLEQMLGKGLILSEEDLSRFDKTDL